MKSHQKLLRVVVLIPFFLFGCSDEPIEQSKPTKSAAEYLLSAWNYLDENKLGAAENEIKKDTI